jgi:hypothetical protein
MNGKTLVIGLAVFVALFGAGLFYTQNYAYYETTDGRQVIEVQGAELPVEGYRGIDATSSGLKRRGCFTVDPAAFEGMPRAEAPEPLTPPFWFDCFDPEAIAQDLSAGEAQAFVAAENELDGIDRIVAVYPDGRAYEWRQLNEKFAD